MLAFAYWKDLGFKNKAGKKEILAKLEQIKQVKKARDRKPSEAKRLFIDLIINNQLSISNINLMTLYNGILYPKVKSINHERIEKMKN